MAEFQLEFHHSIQKKIFLKHQNEVIIAITWSISSAKVVLKSSAASMTSSDMITSMASMTSTASLASKKSKTTFSLLTEWYPWHQDPQQPQNLNSLNNLSSFNDFNSLISSKYLLNLMFPSTLAPKWPILVSQCGMDHQKSTILLISGTLYVGGCGGHGCYF